MSWSAYPDQLASQGVPYSAYCDLDGSILANTCKVTPEEVQTILKSFDNQPNKFSIGGKSYIVHQHDATTMTCAKEGGSACVAKSAKCCIIGVYEGKDMSVGQIREIIGKQRDYFLSIGC